MNPTLTDKEIKEITREAKKVCKGKIAERWQVKAYIAAATAERLKHKAEIQAYREALEEAEGILRREPSAGHLWEAHIWEAHQIILDTLNQFK